jgi:hypothetical protein
MRRAGAAFVVSDALISRIGRFVLSDSRTARGNPMVGSFDDFCALAQAATPPRHRAA